MMLDVDGDGLLDRVTNEPVLDFQGHVIQCQAAWQRNRGGDLGFEPWRYISLPTLKWATPYAPPYDTDPNFPFQGGQWANSSSPGVYIGEGCSLNYQQTNYRNSFSDLWCAPDNSACPAVGYCTGGSDCGTDKNYSVDATILAYRWIDIDGDGLVDLVASPVHGGTNIYNLQWGLGVAGHIPAPPEPALFGTFPPCPSTSFSANSYSPYTMCHGMYPWFIYKNHGNGVFGVQTAGAPLPDQIKYQPIPLEIDTGGLIAHLVHGRADPGHIRHRWRRLCRRVYADRANPTCGRCSATITPVNSQPRLARHRSSSPKPSVTSSAKTIIPR